jgi:hypothetical protein
MCSAKKKKKSLCLMYHNMLKYSGMVFCASTNIIVEHKANNCYLSKISSWDIISQAQSKQFR